jgi:sn-glycerol 3-phosphate transport system permease protein
MRTQEYLEVMMMRVEVDAQQVSQSKNRHDGPATSKQGMRLFSRRMLFTQWSNFGLGILFLAPALAAFAVFVYYPLFRAFWLSLNITNELGEPVKFIGLRYYATILNLDGSNDMYVQSLITSLKFVGAVVLLELVLGLALAALATAKVRGIGIFRLICTLSIAISLASSSVIWSLIFDPSTNLTTWLTNMLKLAQPGLLNNASTALWAVVVASAWSGLGFTFVIALAGMQTIPEELYESAGLDGAGSWHKFLHITLPMLTPTLLFLLSSTLLARFRLLHSLVFWNKDQGRIIRPMFLSTPFFAPSG